MAKQPKSSKNSSSKRSSLGSSGILGRISQRPYQTLVFIIGFATIGTILILRSFASTPPPTLCTASNICVSAGTDLCSVIESVKTGQTIVVRGDSSKPYNMGDCELKSPNIPDIAKLPKNVTLTADSGNKPVLDGTLSFYKPDGWTIRGLTFISSRQVDKLLSITGGDGWHVLNNEFIGGGGYTQVQVGYNSNYGKPVNWTFERNYLHDNKGNVNHQDVQDHLLYVIGGANFNMNATISDNFFVGCLGPSVKLGSTSSSDGDGTSGVNFTRNTLVNKTRNGYSLIVATRSYNINIENNLIFGTDTNGNNSFVVLLQLGAFEGGNIKAKNNNFYGYDAGNPRSHPIFYTNDNHALGNFFYKSAEPGLNQSISVLELMGNVNVNPGYPEYNGKALGCTKYPPLVVNGTTYGAGPCSMGNTTVSAPVVIPAPTPAPAPATTPSTPSTTTNNSSNPTSTPKAPTTASTRDTSPPSTPKGFNIGLGYQWWRGNCSVYTDCQLSLSWTKSTDNTGVKGYQITRSIDGKNKSVIGSTLNGQNSFKDLTISGGHNYQYEISAVDAAGNKSSAGKVSSRVSCIWFACQTSTTSPK